MLTNLWMARYETIPELLQKMIFSARVAEIIRTTAEANHFPPEKIGVLAESVGLVILGFSHAGDLGKEISDRTAINRQVSEIVADELDKKIFSPITGELEKIYAPPSAEEAARPMPPPKKLDAITPPGPAPMPISGKPFLTPAPKPEQPAAWATAPGPKPIDISGIAPAPARGLTDIGKPKPISPLVPPSMTMPGKAAPIPPAGPLKPGPIGMPSAQDAPKPVILENRGAPTPIAKQSPGFRLDIEKHPFAGGLSAQGPKDVDVSRIFDRSAKIEGLIKDTAPQPKPPVTPAPTIRPGTPLPKSYAPPPPARPLPTGPATNIPPKNPLDLIKKISSEKELPSGEKEISH